MFYLEVMNRKNAKDFSYHSHDCKTIIISITDVESNPNSFNHQVRNGIVSVLPMKFDDVNRGTINCITKEDAEKIVKFVRNHVEEGQIEHIIVHCEAGRSRSAGVGAAILKYYTGNDSQIFDSPRYNPNSTCYSMVLEAFYNSEDKN